MSVMPTVIGTKEGQLDLSTIYIKMHVYTWIYHTIFGRKGSC